MWSSVMVRIRGDVVGTQWRVKEGTTLHVFIEELIGAKSANRKENSKQRNQDI